MPTPSSTNPSPALKADEGLAEFIAASVGAARVVRTPFYHLEFDRVFPDDLYRLMMAAMPVHSEYRPMHGRSRNATEETPQTRVKIDLFPEYIRHLPPEKRMVWERVGAALCSETVKSAFRQRLAPPLKRRFGAKFAKVGMFPIPILTRDIPGYLIPPHTDTHWKGITVQFYLPQDESHLNIGTIFHEKLADDSMPKRRQMRFAPNTGYAFAVGEETWHSADRVGPEVRSRDSILLTYFVDRGLIRFVRNRARRAGNFLLNELKNLGRR